MRKATNNDVMRVALDVRADVKTVRKVIQGKPVRGLVGPAIADALVKRGVRLPGR